MEWSSIGELLKDFRSIKLSRDKRTWVDSLRVYFESNGVIPTGERFKLFDLAKKYSRQFKELQEARDRARGTNGLRAMGLSKQEADRLAQAREKQQAHEAADMGF